MNTPSVSNRKSPFLRMLIAGRETGGRKVRMALLFALIQSAFPIAAPCVRSAEPARQAPRADQLHDFENKIRPVLIEHCYECHNSGGKAAGGLKLDFREGLLKGGERGPAIVPGKAADSLLLQAIRHEQEDLRMPQGGPKLKPEVAVDFARWIDQGAVDPRDKPPSNEELAKATSWETTLERRKQWWSFQPLKSVEPPPAAAPWNHPVDRFLAGGWRSASLTPSDLADRPTLIRRVTFALIGLPPKPEEIDRFVRDTSPDAYQRVVDRLLASPQFGERWARHWMDWYRYAETHGSEGDPAVPNAWRYRDYLIRAINEDVPYDQLVREHVAGDLLPKPRINAAESINESALGIGHYRMVQHGYVPTDAEDELVRFTDNQIDTLSKAVLGITLSCARCHNHKFDPLSQKDFYGWFGILASCRPAVITLDTPQRRQEHQAELLALKQTIKARIADAWDASLDGLAQSLEALPVAAASPTPEKQPQGKQPSQPSAPGKKNSRPVQQAVDEAARGPSVNPLGAWVALRARNGKAFADEWQRLGRQWSEAMAQRAAFDAAKLPMRWDLRGKDYQAWSKHGTGLGDRPTLAGDFHVLPDGPQVLSNIYPAGVYTHLISNKQNGVLTSPRFKFDADEIWVRVAGQGGSRARYVVQNYVRAQLIYPAAKPNQETPQWVRWDAKYWKGEFGHIEIATANDLPTDISPENDRAWFGVVEVVGRNANQPAPPEIGTPLFALLTEASGQPKSPGELVQCYTQTLRACVQAWRAGNMTDAQAEFLGFFVRHQLVPNTLDDLPKVASLVADYRELEKQLVTPTRAPGILEGTPFDQPLMVRGDHQKPGEVVRRRFLEAFDATPYSTRQSGRLELAASLSDPRNPLVSRVIVNRLWHHLFGVGIVSTTDNFGRLGEEPTQPELLDYLAGQFSGQRLTTSLKPWSMKSMIRQLVTSRAYQLSSHAAPQALEIDPTNRLLSHFRVRRLEAEAIRDALESVSGQLDLTPFGPSVASSGHRRGIYLQVRRNSLDPLLSAFDFPEPHSTQGRRDSTNVPAQSLTLLNDRLVIDLARHWAERTIGAGKPAGLLDDGTAKPRITKMFLEALGREPSGEELTTCLGYLHAGIGQDQLAQRETERLMAEANRCRDKLQAITKDARQRLLVKQETSPTAPTTTFSDSLPAPIAHWDFDADWNDSAGKLTGEPHGGAKLENGALVLDGKSYLEVAPLPLALREKTLAAWVQCDDLNQRGGGVMSVESMGGRFFDSIVYAERAPKQWLAGSDFFNRTQPFGGSAESEAQDRPVHLAIVYRADGTIAAYRDGQSYGAAYLSKGLFTFEPLRSHVIFGLRHSPAGGDKHFKGRIFQAQLWDRALSGEQVAAWAKNNPRFISEAALLAELPEQDQREYRRLREELAGFDAKLRERIPSAVHVDPLRAWQDLGQSIFNFKEFIYVR